MTTSAFEKFISAFDTSAKREETFGRNFFADAMDANRVNNTLLNDAVTRAFNQQTIDQKGAQFPYTIAGLSRADEIARLMHPANAAMTGVTADYLVGQANNGAYSAQIDNRFNLQGVLGQTNLANARTAAQNAAFTNAYVQRDPAALGAIMGIPAADIAFDPATGVATQVSTGKAIQPQSFNVAMSQYGAKSAAEQAAYLDRMNAVKNMLNPGAANPLPTAPTMGMASRFAGANPGAAPVASAANVPTPMTATGPADFNPAPAVSTPMATGPVAALDNQIAAFAQAGLNTSALQTQKADMVASAMRGMPSPEQRVAMDKQQAQADAARTDASARNVAIRVAASPVGHVALNFAELQALQSFVKNDPTNAARFGLTPAKVAEAIKYNQYIAAQ